MIDVCSRVPILDQLHSPTPFSPLEKVSLLFTKIAPFRRDQEMGSLRMLAFALLLPLVCATNIKYCGGSSSVLIMFILFLVFLMIDGRIYDRVLLGCN